jgi:hypothetical protein
LNVASLRTPPPPSSRVTANLTAKPANKATADLMPKSAPVKMAANGGAAPKPAKTVKPAKAAADPLAPLPTQSKPSPATTRDSGKAR